MNKFLSVWIVLAILAISLGFTGSAFARQEEPPSPQPPDESEFYRNFPGIMPGLMRGLLSNLRRWVPNFLPGGFRSEWLVPSEPQNMEKWFDLNENWGPGIHFNMMGSLRSYFLEALANKLGLSLETLQERIAGGESPYEIAKSQGLTDEQIQDLLQEALNEALQAALSAGDITQEQATLIQTMVKFMGLRMWKLWDMSETDDWKLDSFRGQRTPLEMMGPFYEYRLQIYAKTLGMSVEEIQARLEAGETIGQIAQSQGLDNEEFRSKIVQAAREVLDQAVKDGKLTQEQADWILLMLERWQQGGPGKMMRPRDGWRMLPPERPFGRRGFWFRQP